MRPTHKWRMVLWVPAIAICGTYVLLLGANYYYSEKAALLLQDIRTLQLSPSSGQELSRLAKRDGFRIDKTSDCGDGSCTYWVSPNKHWMDSLLSTAMLLRISPGIGLRRWSAAGGVEIKDGQPVDKWFGIEVFDDKLYSSLAVVTWEQLEFRFSDCEDFHLKRHPGYGFSENDNVPRVFNIHLSSKASAQSLDHAYHFDLGCLKSWRSCERLSELVPDAWADFGDDDKWMDSNRDRLQDGGLLKDTRCHYR